MITPTPVAFFDTLTDVNAWTWDVDLGIRQQDKIVVDLYRGRHAQWGVVALRVREPIPPPEALDFGIVTLPSYGSIWIVLVSHEPTGRSFQLDRVMAELFGDDLEQAVRSA